MVSELVTLGRLKLLIERHIEEGGTSKFATSNIPQMELRTLKAEYTAASRQMRGNWDRITNIYPRTSQAIQTQVY